jgi:hypothetical protein
MEATRYLVEADGKLWGYNREDVLVCDILSNRRNGSDEAGAIFKLERYGARCELPDILD